MLTSWLSLQAGATFQRSRYKEAEKWSDDENVPAETKMFRTPDIYGYFTATLTPFKRFTASLSGTYTGSMLVQHLAGYIPLDKAVETPDFFDMNIKLAYEFPLYKELKLEVMGACRICSTLTNPTLTKVRTGIPPISMARLAREVILPV